MKKLVWVLVTVLTIIFTPVSTVRANQVEQGLLIIEVQTGSLNSASEEFVEIYNPSAQPVQLTQYRLEYFAATASSFVSPYRSFALGGVLAPSGTYLLASSDFLVGTANTHFGATLAKTGGHLRLVRNVNPGVLVDDLVAWGNAAMPEQMAAAAPEQGKSLQRLQNEEQYVDTNNNYEDFVQNNTPVAESHGVSEVPTEPEDPDDPDPEEPTDPEPEIPGDPETPVPVDPVPTVYLTINITELLPNPGSPKTDASDEFIELYNPHDETVDLEGYRLETGNESNYAFTFGPRTIAPKSYLVLYATETNLTLSNSGGKARLLDPSGLLVSETLAYDAAKDNMAWTFTGMDWQWSTTPSPGAENSITAKIVEEKAPTRPKKSTTTKPKTTTTKKAAAPKQPKAAATKAASKTKEDTEYKEPAKKLAMQPVLILAVGAVAVGYLIYEYRSDMANAWHKLRRKK